MYLLRKTLTALPLAPSSVRAFLFLVLLGINVYTDGAPVTVCKPILNRPKVMNLVNISYLFISLNRRLANSLAALFFLTNI